MLYYLVVLISLSFWWLALHEFKKFQIFVIFALYKKQGCYTPERRNDTIRHGTPYHVCTGVIRVVDSKDSPTLSVRGFTGIDFSLSLSLEFTCTTGPKLPERTNEREYCEELGHTTVLGLPNVHPNTSKQRVAHCYPLWGSGQPHGQ